MGPNAYVKVQGSQVASVLVLSSASMEAVR
jgi:hypothetical protein